MKAITFQDVERLAYGTIPDPSLLEPGDALVRVHVAGICGSDLHPYFGRERGLDPGTVMGHELLGAVVEVGAGVRRFKPGDRVLSLFFPLWQAGGPQTLDFSSWEQGGADDPFPGSASATAAPALRAPAAPRPGPVITRTVTSPARS